SCGISCTSSKPLSPSLRTSFLDSLCAGYICVKKRSNGRFTVLRQTIRKRLQTKLNEVKAELQRRMHEPIPEVGKWLQAVVRGHIRYYGLSTKTRCGFFGSK